MSSGPPAFERHLDELAMPREQVEVKPRETSAAQPSPGVEDALPRLITGNQRFAAGRPLHPHQAPQRRLDTVAAQRPFAAILGCADSRVPPELVFDQGLGDLYVVRVAGNLADRLTIASLELAVEDLGVRLIVVLGHDACAAISRTIELLGLSARQPPTGMWTWQHDWGAAFTRPVGHLSELAAVIKPAVDQAYHRGRDLVDAAIDANVRRVVEQLKSSQPILGARVTNAGLRVVGARYRFASGLVTFTD